MPRKHRRSEDNQEPKDFNPNTKAVDETAAEIDALIEADAAEQRAKKAAEQ